MHLYHLFPKNVLWNTDIPSVISMCSLSEEVLCLVSLKCYILKNEVGGLIVLLLRVFIILMSFRDSQRQHCPQLFFNLNPRSFLHATPYQMLIRHGGFPGGSSGKNIPDSTGDERDAGSIPGDWGDPVEKTLATHSSVLAWRVTWTEEPNRLQSVGRKRIGRDLARTRAIYK